MEKGLIVFADLTKSLLNNNIDEFKNTVDINQTEIIDIVHEKMFMYQVRNLFANATNGNVDETVANTCLTYLFTKFNIADDIGGLTTIIYQHSAAEKEGNMPLVRETLNSICDFSIEDIYIYNYIEKYLNILLSDNENISTNLPKIEDLTSRAKAIV